MIGCEAVVILLALAITAVVIYRDEVWALIVTLTSGMEKVLDLLPLEFL